MKHTIYSHRGGDKIIHQDLQDDVFKAVSQCAVKPRAGNTDAMRTSLLNALMLRGWSDEVVLDAGSKITITSVKSKIGLCLQTGNIGRMYADLLKLQTLFLRKTIDAGVIILPTRFAARQINGNVANEGRLVRELPIFEQVITAPLIAIGIE